MNGARKDLLALTSDDLALLSSRGLVKRAARELAALGYTANDIAATPWGAHPYLTGDLQRAALPALHGEEEAPLRPNDLTPATLAAAVAELRAELA